MTMNPRSRKIAVVVGAIALAGGAGIAVAAGGDSAATGDTPSMSRPDGPRGGFDLTALAEKLGVTETQLQDAIEATRSTDGRRPDPASRAQALADELGLPVDKVQAALEETMPQGGPRGGRGGTTPPDGTTPPSGDTSQS